jgi:hypothetical protein
MLLALATSIALLAAAPYPANAGEQTLIRASGGRPSALPRPPGTRTFRYAGGRTSGTATCTESGQTTYRDNRGNTVRTSSR